jgi:hypothetical protein
LTNLSPVRRQYGSPLIVEKRIMGHSSGGYMKNLRSLLPLLALAVISPAAPLLAQSAQPAPYIETFDVRLHDLDVIVTNRAGKPVSGRRMARLPRRQRTMTREDAASSSSSTSSRCIRTRATGSSRMRPI